MPFFLPFALGGLALAALGLKRALEELSPRPAFPEGTRAREAWERHQQALEALRAARQRVRSQAQAYGERQELIRRDTVEPFRALLARLERWEYARASEVLTPDGYAALHALPEGPTPQASRQASALLGVGRTSSSVTAALEWLEKGWLSEDAPPVVVAGVTLYPAASPGMGSSGGEEAVRTLDVAREELGRVVSFLEALSSRLEVLGTRVATLHGRAAAQLAYLDPVSFEDSPAQPRERLHRLGHLMSALAEALRQPALGADGALAPPPEPLAE
jgi:hypothetical protein